MFEVYDPKEFFERFVRTTYKEYLGDSLNEVRVKTVVHQMNVLAERIFVSLNASDPGKINNTQSARAYRRYLVEQGCADFQIVWDMDDGHKHVVLERSGRQVSSAAQSGVRPDGGAIGSMALGEAPLGGTTDEFIVVIDDGSVKRLREILGNVFTMWEGIIAAL